MEILERLICLIIVIFGAHTFGVRFLVISICTCHPSHLTYICQCHSNFCVCLWRDWLCRRLVLANSLIYCGGVVHFFCPCIWADLGGAGGAHPHPASGRKCPFTTVSGRKCPFCGEECNFQTKIFSTEKRHSFIAQNQKFSLMPGKYSTTPWNFNFFSELRAIGSR
jgi:hypothetical protein